MNNKEQLQKQMTEIEKEFFDTFGIEKRCEKDKHCCNWLCNSYQYPQITDHILLELICILSKYQKDRGSILEIGEISLDEIKEEILEMLIYRVDGCKYLVQSLFIEVNNDR